MSVGFKIFWNNPLCIDTDLEGGQNTFFIPLGGVSLPTNTGSTSRWGDITGDIEDQEDLKEALENKVSLQELNDKLEDYVETEVGKGLSTNDFTDLDRGKLSSLENVNIIEGSNISVTGTYPNLTIASSGGGGSGGVSVIEYDPSLNQEIDLVAFNDVESLQDTATISTVTGSTHTFDIEIGVGTPYTGEYERYIGGGGGDTNTGYTVAALIPVQNYGSFTVDASGCNDLWGFGGNQTSYDTFPFLDVHIKNGFYTNEANLIYAHGTISSWYDGSSEMYSLRINTKLTADMYNNTSYSQSEDKPKGVHTFIISNYLSFLAISMGVSEDDLLENPAISEFREFLYAPVIYDQDNMLQGCMYLSNEITHLHFFISSYIDTNNMGQDYPLEPSSKLRIYSNDMGKKINTVPHEITDGAYLKMLGSADLLGHKYDKNDYALLYNSKTEAIRIRGK